MDDVDAIERETTRLPDGRYVIYYTFAARPVAAPGQDVEHGKRGEAGPREGGERADV